MNFEIRDIRKYPWFWIQNEILTVYGSKIGPAGLAVYCVLSHSCRNESGQVKTSLRQIASALGMSPQTAMRSLETLIENKLVQVIKKSKSASEGPSIYALLTVPIGNGEALTVPPEKRYRSITVTAPFHQSNTYNTSNTVKTKNKDIEPLALFENPDSELPESSSPKKINIPAWIPVDAWAGFMEMRDKKKCPATNRAITGLINKLTDLSKGDAKVAGLILDRSTMNGWRDVFKLPEDVQVHVGKTQVSMLEAAKIREEAYLKKRGFDNANR